MSVRFRAVLTACLAVPMGAVLLTACAGNAVTDPAELEGTWVLESYAEGVEQTDVDPAVNSEITFDNGQVTGSGGVNTFSGTYEADDGRLQFGPLASTLMAGEPAAMEQESGFFSALEATESFEVFEGKLVLSGKNNDTAAILVPK
ncbi:MAG: META domain-containing protein [Coriobacteriia bacterium]|nr:META domain-containing protein [Coriobacteriia bacterium]